MMLKSHLLIREMIFFFFLLLAAAFYICEILFSSMWHYQPEIVKFYFVENLKRVEINERHWWYTVSWYNEISVLNNFDVLLCYANAIFWTIHFEGFTVILENMLQIWKQFILNMLIDIPCYCHKIQSFVIFESSWRKSGYMTFCGGIYRIWIT